MEQKNLKGKLAILYRGVFEEGKRMTTEEWAEALYGNKNSTQSIYIMRKKLLRRGHAIVLMPRDPMRPNEAGVLVPLTESREVAKFTNERGKATMDGLLETLGLYFMEELQVFPEMKDEIKDLLRSGVEMHAATIKLVEYGNKQLKA